MKKSELQTLRQYVGDPDSLFGIRDLTFNDGPRAVCALWRWTTAAALR